MAEIVSNGDEIRETDIVFDCPHCGKSLAIDYRGAGLNIECTDCGHEVTVPIPDGMEISDLDSTPEEQETRILNLRKSLTEAEARIAELGETVRLLEQRCASLEDEQQASSQRKAQIREQVTVIQRAQADIYRALDQISEIVADRV